MEDINKEFHLENISAGSWSLFPYQIKRYVHEQKVLQPGEPMISTYEFENPYETQPMMFMITLLPIEKSGGSSVSKISLEVNDYSKIEIPLTMEPSQIITLDRDGKLYLFDKYWKLVKTIVPEGKIPILSHGKNKIIFDADFSGEGASKFKIEMKTIGKAEVVTANKN